MPDSCSTKSGTTATSRPANDASPTLPTPEAPVEHHPLRPFLPEEAKVLMLGSFPPPQKRWSIDFFYPNLQNDMWRIFGLLFYNDKNAFVDVPNKRFKKQALVDFLTEKGIAIYDTACAVRRLQGNASDKFLEIVAPTDISELLSHIPQCKAIVTTGQKATDVLCLCFGIAEQPKVGGFVSFSFEQRSLRLWRMPSSSRAYPMKVERKAEFYDVMFKKVIGQTEQA